MMEIKKFFAMIGASLNPKKYQYLVQNRLGYAFKYISLVLLISFMLMSLLAIPKLVSLPSLLEQEFSAFDHVTVNLNQSMNSAFQLNEKQPYLVIDTRDDVSIGKEKFLLTKDSIYYKQFFSTKHINLSGYKELTSKKTELSNLFLLLVILAIPSFLIVSYFVFLLKYFLIALLVASISFIIVRLIRFGIDLNQLIKISFFSITIMILLDIIFLPFSLPLLPFIIVPFISINIITFILYLILFNICVITVGQKELLIKHA